MFYRNIPDLSPVRQTDGNYISMKRISTQDFITRASEVHGGKYDYSFVGDLHGQDSEVDIICPEHGVFRKSVKLHLRGFGCPQCSKIARSKTMSLVRQNQETQTRKNERHEKERTCFIEKARKVHGEFFDYSKVVYRGCSVPVDIICPKHGIFQQKPILHIQGKGCRLCKIDQRRLPREEFIRRASVIHEGKYDYALTGDFKNNQDSVVIVCPEHGEFSQKVHAHLRGIGCPECGNIKKGLSQRFTKEVFINKANKVHDNKYDYSKTEYVTAMVSVKIICPRHGVFEQKPYQHLIGEGCPKCGHQVSRGETELADWLEKLGFRVMRNVKGLISNRHDLDIYLPDFKVAIEYNGLYWHSSRTGRSPARHLDKLLLCEKQGIRLLQFWDTEWIKKPDICKDIILFAVSRINTRIFARNCEIRQIDSTEANIFLEDNHIQGKCNANFRVGLYLKDELVAVQCYQAPNQGGTSRSSWLLARTAFKRGAQVIGGISRMFRFFVDCVNPEKVIDYTDRRLFIASGHHHMGFARQGVTKVCSYLTDGTNIYSRRHYRHMNGRHFKFHMPWDENLSDTENLHNNGWYWIYDCGKIKNVWRKQS